MRKYMFFCWLVCLAIIANAQKKHVKTNKEDTTIYTAVENSPHPQGGDAALRRYLQHLHYPGKLRDEDIGSHTVMKWVVEKDGSLSNFAVIRGASPQLGKELILVFRSMPKWTPGMQNGKPVRVQYTFASYLDLGMGEM